MSSISLYTERWFLSTNAKDIGTLYLMFALFSGLLGTAFSVLIRMELSGPGVQYIADNQLYNSIITAHALLMMFFMVEKIFFNIKSQPSLDIGMVDDDDNFIKWMAWPCSVEIHYFYFTICWDVFRAFDTNIAGFWSCIRKQQDTFTIQRLRYSENSKD